MSEPVYRILNVAEKPDAAKRIANILSNGKASHVCLSLFFIVTNYF